MTTDGKVVPALLLGTEDIARLVKSNPGKVVRLLPKLAPAQRSLALEALGKATSDHLFVGSALIAALEDPHPYVREGAMRGMAQQVRLGSPVSPELVAALRRATESDERPELRSLAAELIEGLVA